MKFNKIALRSHNLHDPVPEPAAGPGHDDWVEVGRDLLDGGHHRDPVTCIGCPFNISPDKIIHLIKVRTVRRPHVRGDQRL